MKRSKRILSLLLSIVLILGMLPMFVLAADSTFSDVKTFDWFYNDVKYVCEKGLMKGTESHNESRHDRDDPVPDGRRACCHWCVFVQGCYSGIVL